MMNNNVFKLCEQDLSEIPFHDQLKGIIRYIVPDAPYHIAIHKINSLQDHPNEYVQLHKHNSDELNIILSDDETFQYKVTIDDEEKIINAPSVIWIPKGTLHSANVLQGKGFYICLIFQKEYEASK